MPWCGILLSISVCCVCVVSAAGFGFVTMYNGKSAYAACQQLHATRGVLSRPDVKPLTVKLASDPKWRVQAGAAPPIIRVSNYADTIQEKQIEEIFEQYGPIDKLEFTDSRADITFKQGKDHQVYLSCVAFCCVQLSDIVLYGAVFS